MHGCVQREPHRDKLLMGRNHWPETCHVCSGFSLLRWVCTQTHSPAIGTRGQKTSAVYLFAFLQDCLGACKPRQLCCQSECGQILMLFLQHAHTAVFLSCLFVPPVTADYTTATSHLWHSLGTLSTIWEADWWKTNRGIYKVKCSHIWVFTPLNWKALPQHPLCGNL